MISKPDLKTTIYEQKGSWDRKPGSRHYYPWLRKILQKASFASSFMRSLPHKLPRCFISCMLLFVRNFECSHSSQDSDTWCFGTRMTHVGVSFRRKRQPLGVSVTADFGPTCARELTNFEISLVECTSQLQFLFTMTSVINRSTTAHNNHIDKPRRKEHFKCQASDQK